VADEAIPFPGRAESVPISPGLDLVLEEAQIPQVTATVDRRVGVVCGVAIMIGNSGRACCPGVHLSDCVYHQYRLLWPDFFDSRKPGRQPFRPWCC